MTPPPTAWAPPLRGLREGEEWRNRVRSIETLSTAYLKYAQRMSCPLPIGLKRIPPTLAA
jgi:hypothetical protein